MSIPIPKFEIGQRVICVRVSWCEEKVPCPDCVGSAEWKVVAPSGEQWTVPCNTCSAGWHSTGYVVDYDDRIKKEHLTIGSIQVDTERKECPVRYMCRETGVGSGTIWEESRLFATEDQADAYGVAEMNRVKGLRQAEELRQREQKKSKRIYKPTKTARAALEKTK